MSPSTSVGRRGDPELILGYGLAQSHLDYLAECARGFTGG